MLLHDIDIRPMLYDYLDERFGKVRTFDEKIIGKSRSDIVAVTDGAIIGFEIKSDADSYTRLPTQIKDYDKFFDFNYVVIGKSHSKHISEHIPVYWGILVTDDENNCIFEAREAQKNPKVKIENQMKLMWKRELWAMLDKNKLPKYREKSRAFVSEKLIEKLPAEHLKRCMTEELFERDYTTLKTSTTPKRKIIKRARKLRKR